MCLQNYDNLKNFDIFLIFINSLYPSFHKQKRLLSKNWKSSDIDLFSFQIAYPFLGRKVYHLNNERGDGFSKQNCDCMIQFLIKFN